MSIGRVLGQKKKAVVLPKDLWCTPDYLFNGLDFEFDFGIDAAASLGDTKCADYISKEGDAFRLDWLSNHLFRKNAFCNPPYSPSAGGLINWVERGYEQSQRFGIQVAFVVPGDTSTKYRKFAMKYGSEIRDLDHRVRFVGASGSPPWPTAIFIFRPVKHRKIGGAHISVWDYREKNN